MEYYYIIRDKDASNYDPLMIVVSARPISSEVQDSINAVWQEDGYDCEMLKEQIYETLGDDVKVIVDDFAELWF